MTLNDLEPSERRRLARSAGAGGALWLLMAVGLAFVPIDRQPVPKPDFPPVHLTLTSPATASVPQRPVETPKTTESPSVSPSPETTTATRPKPAAQAKPAAQTKPAAKSAQAAAKTSAKPAAPAAPAATGLGIPDFDRPVTSSPVDSGTPEFLDFSSSRTSESPSVVSVPAGGRPTAELEGSAATVTGGKSTGTSVSSKAAKTAGSSGTASAETSSALRAVEGAAMAGSSEGSTASGKTSPTGGSAGSGANVSTSTAGRTSSVAGLAFTGTPRSLLSPEDPRITLPDRLAKQIDSDRTVTVQFTVRADGSVPGTLVTFSPLAALPAEIRDYLRGEFSKWRFESGDQDGQARFSYSIKME